MTDYDLFGQPVVPKSLPLPAGAKKRHETKPNGYAARPGTGPKGETCKSCRHIYRHRLAKVYLKCKLMVRSWTGGPGTDIRAGSPACQHWASAVEKDPNGPRL